MFSLILRFYRSYVIATLLVTIVCTYVYWKRGKELLPDLILFKLITGALIAFIADNLRQKEAYYYYNLHLSKQRLWLISLSFDLLVMLLLVLFTHFISS